MVSQLSDVRPCSTLYILLCIITLQSGGHYYPPPRYGNFILQQFRPQPTLALLALQGSVQ